MARGTGPVGTGWPAADGRRPSEGEPSLQIRGPPRGRVSSGARCDSRPGKSSRVGPFRNGGSYVSGGTGGGKLGARRGGPQIGLQTAARLCRTQETTAGFPETSEVERKKRFHSPDSTSGLSSVWNEIWGGRGGVEMLRRI